MVAVTASVHDLGVAGLISGVGVTIEFSLLKPIVTIGDVVSVEPVLVPFSGGLASLVLPPSPVGNAYRVLVRGAGAQLAWYVIIPDVAAITLGTLILSNQVDGSTFTVTPPNAAWAAAVATEAATRSAADNRTLAKNPDGMITGVITGDPVVTAAVEWPDGTLGVLTVTARHTTGAVNSYTITYGNPVTQTYTQPTITRSATGAATFVPQIVVT